MKQIPTEGNGLVTVSPDGHVKVLLEYLGEIRFGPPYYALRICSGNVGKYASYEQPGCIVPYGATLGISPDSHLLVVERWSSLATPDNMVVLIDVPGDREADLYHLGPGFLRGITFESDPLKVRLTADIFEGGAWTTRSYAAAVPQDSAWRPSPR